MHRSVVNDLSIRRPFFLATVCFLINNMIHVSSLLSFHFSSPEMSVINLPLWLHEWMKKAVFHQLTLSCAVTLSDNRLLDPHTHLFMVLFPDWSQQPAHHRPFCLSCCRAAKETKKTATPGHHIRLTVGHYFFPSFQTVIQITLYIKEQTHHLNTAVIYCLWKENTQKPWRCICANWEQMDSHSMASKVNREV